MAEPVKSIGTVEKLSGLAWVRRPDGTVKPLEKGDPIFQGDVIETGPDGNVGVSFVDHSAFSLGARGRMSMDEMVFDPATQEGALTVSMLKGAYSFVSGQIAKSAPMAMNIKTPVMTIGVRGTSGAGHAGGEGENNSLVLLQDPGGTVGEITLTNAGGTRTINQVNFSVSLSSYIQPPPLPVFLSGQQVDALYGSILSANPQPPQPSYAPPPPPPPAAEPPPPATGHGSGPSDPVYVPPPPISTPSAPQPPGPVLPLPPPPDPRPVGPQETRTGSPRTDTPITSGNPVVCVPATSRIIQLTANNDTGAAFTEATLNTVFHVSGNGNGQISTIGGTDAVTGGSGTNQIAVDNVDATTWLLIDTGADPHAGSARFFSGPLGGGTLAATLNFSGIQQFLFSTGNVVTGFVANAAAPVFGSGPQAVSGDLYVLPTLAANQRAVVTSSTSGADTVILAANLSGAQKVLAFGNGGGDTFDVSALGHMLLVGGHGTGENVDTNADGLADSDQNTLTFAGLNTSALTASSTAAGWGSNGQKGLAARIGVASSGGLGADMEIYDRFSGTPASQNPSAALLDVLAWDISALTLTSGDDSVRMGSIFGGYAGAGGSVSTIDTGAGDDEILIQLSQGGHLGTVYAGNDADTVSVYGGTVGTIDAGTGLDSVFVIGGNVTTVVLGGAGADTMQVINDAHVHWVNASGSTALVNAYVAGTATVDTITGSSGSDSLTFASSKTALESLHFDAGLGSDRLLLNSGNYASQTTLNYISGVEKIDLSGAYVYDLRLVDTNVASGQGMTVDASTLTAGKLVLDGSAETDGTLTVTGGGGNDTIGGGAGVDTLTGGGGNDVLTGGTGTDIFRFANGTGASAAAKVASLGTDTITDFVNGTDVFQLSNATFGLGSSGPLSNLALNTSLSGVIGAGTGIVAIGTANSGSVDLYYCDDLSNASSNSYQIAHVTGLSVNQVDVSDFQLST